MATLLKDIAAADVTLPTMLGVGSNLYYVARNAGASADLYITDGSDAGTSKLASFPAFANPATVPVANLTATANGLVYFTANDGPSGIGLWKTNGTTAGTVLVKELPSPWSPSALTAVGNSLFFVANDGQTGNEVWVSDGTGPGTSVLDVVPGAGGLNPSSLVSAGGTLYFAATQAATGTELWKSNGTVAGTQVIDLAPGASGSFPTGITAVGSTLFSMADSGAGQQLWKLDGPNAAPVALTTNPGGINAFNFAAVGSNLFFVVTQGTDNQLWKSDGSLAGTTLVRNFPGAASTPAYSLTATAAGLSFIANDGSGAALWRSDGSTGGTVPVTDATNNRFLNPTNLSAVGTSLFFTQTDASGSRLWRTTQAAPASASLVRDLAAFVPGSPVASIVGAGAAGYVNFSQTPDGLGRLVRSDGTNAGTSVFRSYSPIMTLDANPRASVSLNAGTLLFQATDTNGVDGLYRTDGTSGGTFLVSSFLYRNAGTSAPTTILNGNAFFMIKKANFLSQNIGLWRTDGTGAGTVRVSGIDSALGLQGSDAMVAFNGALYFNIKANDGSFQATQLWRSDGLVGGTTNLVQTFGGPFNGSIGGLTVAGNRLFLIANDGTGSRLWRLDAGAGSAVPVTDGGGNFVANPSGLIAVGTTLFLAAGPNNNQTLWRVDPSTGVASQVSNGIGNVAVAMPAAMGALGSSSLFFKGGPNGTLWSVGTTGNASEVLAGGASVTNPGPMVTLGSSVFFAADNASGRELWKSDGTSAGTGPVKDINPGAGSSNPTELTVLGPNLLFMADNGVNGVEPWMSDGTTAGTRIAADINQGSASSRVGANRVFLGTAGSKTILAATDGSRGLEPWAFDLAPPSNTAPVFDPIADQFVLVGQQDKFQVTASDTDVGSLLSFSLVSPPAGAAIDPASGVFTWSPTTAGVYPITVRVVDNGSPALFATRTFVVTVSNVGAGTYTGVDFAPSSVSYGQMSTFYVAVRTNSGTGTPVGSATFFNGTTPLGTANLVNGVGTLLVNSATLGSGTYQIWAQYLGGSGFGSSISPKVNFVVNPAVTATQLSAPASSINLGQSITFGAVLYGANGTVPTGGTVSFFDGNTLLGTAPALNGSASLLVSGLGVGTHPISLSYSGTQNFQASSTQPWNFTVNAAATTTTLNVPPGPFLVGQSYTMTASVTSSLGSPTGNVTFFDGATAIGTVALVNGTASLNVSTRPPGTRSITARYLGNATLPASTSAPNNVTILTSTVQSISVTRSGNTITSIVLRTSGLLDAASVAQIGNYSLAFGRVSGRNVIYDINIGLRAAVYSASANTITITPAGGRINFTGTTLNSTARLVVNSVRDVSGTTLMNRTASGMFTALMTRTTVTVV